MVRRFHSDLYAEVYGVHAYLYLNGEYLGYETLDGWNCSVRTLVSRGYFLIFYA